MNFCLPSSRIMGRLHLTQSFKRNIMLASLSTSNGFLKGLWLKSLFLIKKKKKTTKWLKYDHAALQSWRYLCVGCFSVAWWVFLKAPTCLSDILSLTPLPSLRGSRGELGWAPYAGWRLRPEAHRACFSSTTFGSHFHVMGRQHALSEPAAGGGKEGSPGFLGGGGAWGSPPPIPSRRSIDIFLLKTVAGTCLSQHTHSIFQTT